MSEKIYEVWSWMDKPPILKEFEVTRRTARMVYAKGTRIPLQYADFTPADALRRHLNLMRRHADSVRDDLERSKSYERAIQLGEEFALKLGVATELGITASKGG